MRCSYNLLFWVMFHFDLYLMHKCIHKIVYNLSVPPLNGSTVKGLSHLSINASYLTLLWQRKNGAFESCCLVRLKGNNSWIFKMQLWTSTRRKPKDDIKPIWIHHLYLNVVTFVLRNIIYIYLKMIMFSIVELRRSTIDIILVRNCKYSCCLMLLSNYKNAEDWFSFYMQLCYTLLF